MAAPYLTAAEAESLLFTSYGLDVSLLAGHVQAASVRLDEAGPFYGVRLSYDQPRAFPRTFVRYGDTADQVPDGVKQWVALEAAKLSKPDEPGLNSLSMPHLGSRTFARPRMSKETMLQAGLLAPYQAKTGTMG